jgi:uncharacterized membrane protein
MFLSISFMAISLGLISGLLWSFALDNSLKSGMAYGGTIGLAIGILSSIANKNLINTGTNQTKEVVKASGSMLTGIFIISLLLAFLVGIVKWIFF